MKNSFKKLTALLLAATLLSAMPVQALATQPQIQPTKEEVVYVKLLPDGTLKTAYVVNSFELSENGQFVDYGDYDKVENLTTTDTLTFSNAEIHISAPKGKFYYQGNLQAPVLPWKIAISYKLDGKPIAAEEAAGKTGQLEIVIDTLENPEANPAFAKYYSLQTSLTLDTERCSSIEAPDATIAASGKNKILNFIKMPNSNAQYTVKMQVADFEMAGIQISAIPFSMSIDLPDTDDMTGDLAKLQDGIGELNDGTWKLADGGKDLGDGIGKFDNGLNDMWHGMSKLEEGFSELVGNNSEIRNGSAQILKALTTIKNSLSGLDAVDLTGLTDLTEGSSAILGGIQQLSGGLAGMQAGLSDAEGLQSANQDAISSLNSQIEDLVPGESGNDAQIQQLTAIVNLLSQNNQLIEGMQTGINAVAPGASALATQYEGFNAAIQKLPAMIQEMAGGMLALKSGMDALATNYTKFDSGLKEYLSGTSKLNEGYAQICDGFGDVLSASSDLSTGANDLHDGMLKLADGTDEMQHKTADMDSQMQDKIDDLLSDYIVDDFEAVSFVSDKNTNVNLVQFVMMTDEIKAEKTPDIKEAAPASQNFWQRLLALFNLKGKASKLA